MEFDVLADNPSPTRGAPSQLARQWLTNTGGEGRGQFWPHSITTKNLFAQSGGHIYAHDHQLQSMLTTTFWIFICKAKLRWVMIILFHELHRGGAAESTSTSWTQVLTACTVATTTRCSLVVGAWWFPDSSSIRCEYNVLFEASVLRDEPTKAGTKLTIDLSVDSYGRNKQEVRAAFTSNRPKPTKRHLPLFFLCSNYTLILFRKGKRVAGQEIRRIVSDHVVSFPHSGTEITLWVRALSQSWQKSRCIILKVFFCKCVTTVLSCQCHQAAQCLTVISLLNTLFAVHYW